ncbi:Hypothetical predicted protein [Cloeon dipterum]|uniref:Uncharacterized protein n=1 Tax=Cloeon dipterum TaxID=197152 RepID=A0A8S1CYF5_9INSE|nr:Hypothetical predicted protein [Cloeon dipterum]
MGCLMSSVWLFIAVLSALLHTSNGENCYVYLSECVPCNANVTCYCNNGNPTDVQLPCVDICEGVGYISVLNETDNTLYCSYLAYPYNLCLSCSYHSGDIVSPQNLSEEVYHFWISTSRYSQTPTMGGSSRLGLFLVIAMLASLRTISCNQFCDTYLQHCIMCKCYSSYNHQLLICANKCASLFYPTFFNEKMTGDYCRRLVPRGDIVSSKKTQAWFPPFVPREMNTHSADVLLSNDSTLRKKRGTCRIISCNFNCCADLWDVFVLVFTHPEWRPTPLCQLESKVVSLHSLRYDAATQENWGQEAQIRLIGNVLSRKPNPAFREYLPAEEDLNLGQVSLRDDKRGLDKR